MAFSLAPQIEKLTSTNYSTWKNDIQFLLLEKGALDIVLGTETRPDVTKEGDQAKLDDFIRRSNTAMSIIYLNVSPEWRSTICDVRDPKIAWDLLRTKFQPDSRAHHMALYAAVMTCFIEEGEHIGQYASRLTGIAEQLSSIGKPFPDEYLCFQILRFLPNKFDLIVQQILQWPESRFVFKEVSVELAAEEARLAVRDSDRLHRQGLPIEIQSVKFKRRPQVTCWKCGMKGHVQQNCRVKLTPAKPDTKSAASNKASSTETKGKVNPTRQQTKPKSSSKSKTFNFLVETSLSACGRDGAWVFDTGASHHFCKDRALFSSLNETAEEMHVAVGGVTFPIIGKGKITLLLNNKVCVLHDVFYSPNLRKNLLSGPRFDQGGATFIGQNGSIQVLDCDEDFLFLAKLYKGIYYTFPKVLKNYNFEKGNQEDNVNGGLTNSECFNSVPNSVNPIFERWHLRMAHLSPDVIVKTSKNRAVKGIPVLKHPPNHFCEPCVLNKRNRISFRPLSQTSAKKPLDRIFMDTWGPIPVSGRNRERFFLSIIDDFSGKAATYPLRDKTQVFDIFQRHIKRAELFLNTKLKAIRTDQGSEFVNSKFKDYCDETGVKHELTNTHTPEENGVCERFNQTILNCVRAMLNSSGLPPSFWPDACLHFTYTWNRVCHAGSEVTPFELYSGNKPSVRHLRPFGTLAYVGIPKVRRNHKLDVKAKKGALVGYALRTRGYRVWIPADNKIVETIDVSLVEGKFFSSSGAVMGDFLSDSVIVTDEEPRPVDRSVFPGPESGESSGMTEESRDEAYLPAPSSTPPVDSSTSQSSKSTVVWFRKIVPRPVGGKVDIYYYPDGKGKKCPLRSPREVKEYCEEHNLEFKPEDFSFSKSNTFEGVVNSSNDGDEPTLTASFSKS